MYSADLDMFFVPMPSSLSSFFAFRSFRSLPRKSSAERALSFTSSSPLFTRSLSSGMVSFLIFMMAYMEEVIISLSPLFIISVIYETWSMLGYFRSAMIAFARTRLFLSFNSGLSIECRSMPSISPSASTALALMRGF
ncbi:MAG: hypothetical protein ACD_47C00150G0001 [uncultured bacterium]|nr:MAG: hypothetical protein ACD_47C00150G0001 [uncultured bacterium]